MVQRAVWILVISLMIGLSWSHSALARPFEVFNLQVSAQSTDAVKARDEAIAQAQRKAFIAITNSTEEDVASVTNTEISRLVRGFSLRNERLASRSYSANFTIRFNPNALVMFTQSRGLVIAPAAQSAAINAGPALPASASQTGQAADAATGNNPAEEAPLLPQIPTTDTVIVLPVLDIGSRTILWGDPNPWREVWQKEDYSPKDLHIRVPLGDIADVTDVPDTGFMTGGKPDLGNVLTRYSAAVAYVTVIKNQGSGGAMISLYRHDGNRLGFIRKIIIQPRPGYMFDDAVPAAVRMIVAAHKNTGNQQDAKPVVTSSRETVMTDPYGREVREQELPDTVSPYDAASEHHGTADSGTRHDVTRSSGTGSSLEVTIPYQSLQQWVGIQNRLRLVSGVKAVIPVRVSPSSAKVRLQTTVSDTTILQRNLSEQRFDLQYLPTGEIVLIGQ